MQQKKYKKTQFLQLFIIIFIFCIPNLVKADTLAARLSGKILLQVEVKGEAYYVDPVEQKRHYLGRPLDAFNVMRSLGLGTSNADINNFLRNGARKSLAGRILLKVQENGQAYYVNPDNLKLYYLGRPLDAFNVMRSLGLGISNADLSKIPLSALNKINNNSNNSVDPYGGLVAGKGEHLVKFSWKYKNKDYTLEKIFSTAMYNDYKNSPKYLTYPSNNPPENLREAYYGIFLKQKNGDLIIDDILKDLKKISVQAGHSDDESLEFILAFVQYIPYDYSKSENSPQNFPYETLYKNSGICSDKTLLATLMLRKLGYGSAIFDYPDRKHSVVAVSCTDQSSYNSGYCFVETTNYFPIGVFPRNLSDGQANSVKEFDWENIFRDSFLGKVEVYQKLDGPLSYSMRKNVNTVNVIIKQKSNLQSKAAEIEILSNQLKISRTEIEQIFSLLNYYQEKGDISSYNNTVNIYNAKVQDYNSLLSTYKLKVEVYNGLIDTYNQSVSNFLQN